MFVGQCLGKIACHVTALIRMFLVAFWLLGLIFHVLQHYMQFLLLNFFLV